MIKIFDISNLLVVMMIVGVFILLKEENKK